MTPSMTPCRPSPLLLILLLCCLPAAAEPPPFCVEDGDDALWIDCERNRTGIAGREQILCRREPHAALIEVTDVARRLQLGEGDCRAPGVPIPRGRVPRGDEADEPGTEPPDPAQPAGDHGHD